MIQLRLSLQVILMADLQRLYHIPITFCTKKCKIKVKISFIPQKGTILGSERNFGDKTKIKIDNAWFG